MFKFVEDKIQPIVKYLVITGIAVSIITGIIKRDIFALLVCPFICWLSGFLIVGIFELVIYLKYHVKDSKRG